MDTSSETCGGETRGGGSDVDGQSVDVAFESCGGESGGGGGPCGGVDDVDDSANDIDVVGS
jgi:hypothetical protein